uniref:Uncharacterized protein n=1 Tax=Oncorhynchus tshawytscha TaxID=74940 RepID=A0AAZ3QQE4_ONCTS
MCFPPGTQNKLQALPLSNKSIWITGVMSCTGHVSHVHFFLAQMEHPSQTSLCYRMVSGTDVPSPGPEAPSPGPEAPSPGPEAPSPGPEAPSLGTEAPSLGTDAPSLGTDAPSLGTDAPSLCPKVSYHQAIRLLNN